jgi:hypothetical protein
VTATPVVMVGQLGMVASSWSPPQRAARGAPRQPPSVTAAAGGHAESPCTIRLADFRIGETAPAGAAHGDAPFPGVLP